MSNRLSSIPERVIELLPESLAREHTIISIEADAESVTIATPFDPGTHDVRVLDEIAILQDKLEFVLQAKVRLECHPARDITSAVDRHFTNG
jgi:hypothetical protein